LIKNFKEGERIMGALKKSVVAGLMLLAVVFGTAFGQGPMKKRVNFDINVTFAMRMGEYLLPPGHYVISQVDDNDLNMFYLFKDDMRHSPIATIKTTRKEYAAPWNYPEKTEMRLKIEETKDQGTVPVLHGWDIPGDDGWTIIGVVPKKDSMLTKIQ
jgi:hypothetical protein